MIPRAKGEALQTIQEAEGYALDRVNRSQGDAALFTALYDELPQGARGHAQAHVPRDHDRGAAPGGEQDHRRRRRCKGVLPLLNLDPSRSQGR